MLYAGLKGCQEHSEREVSDIYTRDFSARRRGGDRYTPPPGYDGIAFGDSIGMKRHEADVDISQLSGDRVRRDDADQADSPDTVIEGQGEGISCALAETENKDVSRRDSRTLEELFHTLRGKIGTEELILILVMLVVASGGIGIEVLLLGLLLIAG